ncbi:MAG: FHA domain-containing protein [Planctomycetota bacterium]|nr:FHA domain-containing protein [Planctomycetota bacterium]MDA1140120.1 FHA domain-containing protein [Planctomycetota bacterium]
METVATFMPIRERLSREAFVEQYKFPFMVQQPEKAGTKKDDKFEFQTIQLTAEELEAATTRILPRDQPVYRLVKRGTNAFGGMINVGRAGNNDVVLDIHAISKFHAYFSMDISTGRCYLTDADSTNGSFINRSRLTPHNRYVLDNADIVSFAGTVELKFYKADGFWEMLSTVI